MTDHPVLLVDLDGTITDSLPGIAASLHHALEVIGASWDDSRDIREAVGPPMPETFASLGINGEARARAMTAYRERYTEIGWLENSVFTGMRPLLESLADERYRMAVATSKDERAARRILEHFDLAHHFEFIGGADLAVGRSAKAEVIAHSLTALEVNSADAGVGAALMIGDRGHDVEGAAHFGIPTALVRWGYGSTSEWESAHWSVENVNQLEEIIRGL